MNLTFDYIYLTFYFLGTGAVDLFTNKQLKNVPFSTHSYLITVVTV